MTDLSHQLPRLCQVWWKAIHQQRKHRRHYNGSLVVVGQSQCVTCQWRLPRAITPVPWSIPEESVLINLKINASNLSQSHKQTPMGAIRRIGGMPINMLSAVPTKGVMPNNISSKMPINDIPPCTSVRSLSPQRYQKHCFWTVQWSFGCYTCKSPVKQKLLSFMQCKCNVQKQKWETCIVFLGQLISTRPPNRKIDLNSGHQMIPSQKNKIVSHIIK